MITSGATPPNPVELLQSNAMAAVLADLHGRYDVVIVDAPPLLPVADAAVIATASDGAILVVRHSRTTREQATQARARLESVGASLLGTVLNFVPERSMRGYGYGYGYGYAPKSGVPADAPHPTPDVDGGGVDDPQLKVDDPLADGEPVPRIDERI